MPWDPLHFCTSVQLSSCPDGLHSLPAHSQICCDVQTLRCLQVPIIGFIGRLDYQKGADLVLGAAHWLLNQDVQIICLGTGDKHLEVKLVVITNSRLVAPHHYVIALLHTDEVACLSCPSFVNMRGLYTCLQ